MSKLQYAIRVYVSELDENLKPIPSSIMTQLCEISHEVPIEKLIPIAQENVEVLIKNLQEFLNEKK